MNFQRVYEIILIIFISFYCVADAKDFPIEVAVQTGFSSQYGNGVNSVCFSTDGRYLVTGNMDGIVRLWELYNGNLRTYTSNFGGASSAKISPDGNYIAACSGDKTVLIWDVASGQLLQNLRGFSRNVSSIYFSPNSKYIVSACFKTLKLWDVLSGELIREFDDHRLDIAEVRISPDGKYIASAGWDQKILFWEILTGKQIKAFEGHSSFIRAICFSPDGKNIVSGGNDKTAILWDVSSGRAIRTFSGHSRVIQSIDFSSTGKYIVTGSADSTVKLWDVSSGKLIRSYTGRSGEISTISISPDSKYIVTGSFDASIPAWDIKSGNELVFLTAIDKKEWICSTREGLFDCSEKAKNNIYYLRGTSVYHFEQYANDFYRKGLLSDMLSGKKYTLPGSAATLRLFHSKPPESNSGLFLQNSSVPTTADPPVRVTFQSGHNEGISEIKFSPNGRLIASSGSNQVILWEKSSGRQIRIFEKAISLVNFSPDGKYILATDESNKLNVYEVISGNIVNTLPWGYGYLSNNGKYFATITGRSINLYEAASCRQIREFNTPIESRTVCFSPDGNSILTVGEGRVISLWEISTGRQIRTFSTPLIDVWRVNFSPDGRYFVTGGDGKSFYIIDLRDGRQLRTFTKESWGVRSVSFSPDGKYILVDGSRAATLWEIATGNQVKTYDGYSCVFSPDGNEVITYNDDNMLILWNSITGHQIRPFSKKVSSRVFSISISKDGKYIATGHWDNTAKLWDLTKGRQIRTLSGHSKGISAACFSSDGKYLATGSSDGTIAIWETSSGKRVRTLKNNSPGVVSTEVWSLDYSPDGKYIAAGYWHQYARIWDVSTGREILYLPESPNTKSIRFCPDGKYILTGSLDGDTKLWIAANGKLIRTFPKHEFSVDAVCFSPDGKNFVEGSFRETFLWEVKSGRHISTFKGHSNSITAVDISPDGKYLLTASDDKTAILWDISNHQKIHIFSGHIDEISSTCFSPDGKNIVTGSEDGTSRIWNIKDGNELLSLSSYEDNEWITISKEGSFDSSEESKKNINFVKGIKVYDLDQFFEDFYRPGLLAEVMSGKELKRPDLNASEKLSQSPPPIVEIVSPKVGDTFTQKEIEIVVKIIDTGGGIDEAVLLHNNKRVPDDTRGFQIANDDQNSVTKKYIVNLLEGENVFRASAFSKGRIESRGYELTVFFKGVTATANSYVFVIGIDQYKNTKYNLNYAYADAAGVKDLIVNKSAKLFRNTFIHELYNSDANSNNIKSIFNEIMPKIQPQDVFTFFYAGHGVMVPDENGKEQFYLIPTEVTSFYDEEKIHQSGSSGKQLVQCSSQIAARKQLFIIDACQAGGISNDFVMRGFAEEKALAQLARSAGIHVIASSQSDQYASEFSELGHGLFTYALIQAFNGKAEAPPPDGKITIYEIKAYLENVIPDLSKKYKGQAQYPVSYTNGQDFPVVVE